jgi:hypothetical protein
MGLWSLDDEEPLTDKFVHSCRRTQSALDVAVMRMYGDADRLKNVEREMKSNYANLREIRMNDPTWKPSRPSICRSTWQSENRETQMSDLMDTLYSTEPTHRTTRPPGGFVSRRSLPTLRTEPASLPRTPCSPYHRPPDAPAFPFPARRSLPNAALPFSHGLGIRAPQLSADLVQQRAAMAARFTFLLALLVAPFPSSRCLNSA